MTLPHEMLDAVFPREFKRGNVAAGPLTLRHAVVLDVYGVDAADAKGKDITEANGYRALWIMSLGPDALGEIVRRPDTTAAESFGRWMENDAKGIGAEEAAETARAILANAWRAFVPAKSSSTAFTPTGYGWPLMFAEAFAAEYGMPFEEALDIPMCRLFAMIACARRRNGGEDGGPDYYDRIIQGG